MTHEAAVMHPMNIPSIPWIFQSSHEYSSLQSSPEYLVQRSREIPVVPWHSGHPMNFLRQLPKWSSWTSCQLPNSVTLVKYLRKVGLQVQSPDWAEAVCVKSFISYSLLAVGRWFSPGSLLRFPPPDNWFHHHHFTALIWPWLLLRR